MSGPAPADPMTNPTLPAATPPTDPALTGAPGTAPPGVETPPTSAEPSSTSTSEAETEEPFQPLPVDYAEPPAPSGPQLTGTDEDLLTGPSDVSPNAPYQEQDAVPPKVHAWLPALQAAANDPSAPVAYKNLFRLAMQHLGT